MTSPPPPSPPDNDFSRELTAISLESRMKSSYLDYAMSVIVGRALPDVRDGLKPVHRRTLYSMHETNNDWNKAYKKSARIVGNVLGKYHPHGTNAVYDALVRMAQPFSMGFPLVDGQGNFGSIDGDNPAAMRYTEVRLARIAHQLLDDLDKETVDFIPNYDGSEVEPSVLPARFPNLLVNGSSGIAVGMATNIPPHNLGEVIDACLYLIKNPDADVEQLINFIPAPDFPTGAYIYGIHGAREAYRTGRGRVVMRSKTHFEDLDKSGARQAIIIDELPYQVNKATLITKIADLARDKRIEGISDLRDESDRRGIRVVIELRRGENSEVILNKLYKETSLQESFSINIVALTKGEPKQLNLRDLITLFLEHRYEVIVRRLSFELRKARIRAHLLEGYAAAVENIDAVIELIKTSPSPAQAEIDLLAKLWPAQVVADMLKRLDDPASIRPDTVTSGGLEFIDGKPFYRFSPEQVRAILDLRLARLTAMERQKIQKDYADIVQQITDLILLLSDDNRIQNIIANELKETRKQFVQERRSEIIVDADEGIDIEQLINREDMAVTFSHRGYVKRQAVSDYRTQKRGGRGRQAATTREDDFINRLFIASTHDYLLILTNRGRVYWRKVYELPLASRISRGRPIVNILELMEHEVVQTVLPVSNFEGERYVVMATTKGVIKKTPLEAFSRPRRGGIAAINLDDDDRLINAAITQKEDSILLFSNSGKAVRFRESNLRPIGRSARGVRGMKLPKGGQIVSMLVFSPEWEADYAVLVATAKGRGKRTHIGEFVVKNRGGQGVMALRISDKTGDVIGATIAAKEDELMLITDRGVLVRTGMADIRRSGRSAQGVRLINLDEGAHLVSVARIVESKDDEESE